MRKLCNLTILLFFISFIAKANPADNDYGYHTCNQPYALCTTATCTPVPGTDLTVCTCVVLDGISLGKLSCEARKPTNKNSQMQLISNFSLVNTSINKSMTCSGNAAWTNCLDKPCVVDPKNSNIAICNCDIKRTESFVTFGGSCDTGTCSNTLYSAATKEEAEQGTKVILKALKLSESPVKLCERGETETKQ